MGTTIVETSKSGSRVYESDWGLISTIVKSHLGRDMEQQGSNSPGRCCYRDVLTHAGIE